MRDELQVYLDQVPTAIKKDVNNILRIEDNEERWKFLRYCFLAYAPELIDNQFAWNLYKETV
jgi:hypothetical protein